MCVCVCFFFLTLLKWRSGANLVKTQPFKAIITPISEIGGQIAALAGPAGFDQCFFDGAFKAGQKFRGIAVKRCSRPGKAY